MIPRITNFTKFIVMTATVVALAAPGPARASDSSKILAGLLGVVIVGAALSELADKQKSRSHPQYAPVGRANHGHTVQPRALPSHVQRYTLPNKCVRAGNPQAGNALLGRGCLKRHYGYADSLPGNCTVKYWNQRKGDVRKGYALNCLHKHGYRMAHY
ncbi:MAG: hypothetical protein AB3N23_20025 [Paracoccaceae bacterium]